MMYYRLLMLLAGCWCLAAPGSAQNVRLAYFGETVTHYGLRGGVEYPLLHTEKPKDAGSVQNEWLLGIHLTVFRHPQNHLGVAVSPELSWRRTGKRGGVVQAGVSAGVFRSIYEAKTYRPNDDGTFTRVPLAGQWGFLPGVSLGVGKDFSVRQGAPILLFTNVHYMQQYPYNGAFLRRPALEAGIIFKN